MVTANSGKAELHVQSMTLITDISEYFVYVSIRTVEFIPIFTEVNIKSSEVSQKFKCVESVFESSSYRSKLVDIRQFDIINKVFPSINYTGDSSSMLKKLGLKCLTQKTGLNHWVEPTHNFESLIRALNENTVVPNGGAPRWMLDTTGAFVMVDLVQSFNQKPIVIKGSVESDILDMSWIHSYPGNLNLFYSSAEEISKIEIKLDEKFPWGRAILNDCNLEELDSFVTKYKSEFLFKKFTTRKIRIEKLQSITFHVGDCVLVNNKVQGVITAINLNVRLNTESPKHSVLVACPE